MGSKELSEFFNVEEVEEDNSDIVLSATIDPPHTTVEDLCLVKPEEVRQNYDIAQQSLIKNLDIGNLILDEIKDNLRNTELNVSLYDNASKIIKANNETAKILASLHTMSGILGNTKNIEIDNSRKEIHLSSSDMQEVVKLMKKK